MPTYVLPSLHDFSDKPNCAEGGERMAADDMRSKERAWLCAGHRWDFSEDIDFPDLFTADNEPAILLIPEGWDEDRRELAFGWACAEVVEQRGGWLFLVKRLIYMTTRLSRRAS